MSDATPQKDRQHPCDTRYVDHIAVFQRLHEASQAIAVARDEAGAGRALIGFAEADDVDVARLLVFTDIVDGRPAMIEMREGWSRDKRRLPSYGTPLSLSDFSILASVDADSTVTCENVDTDERLDDASRHLITRFGLSSFTIIPLTAKRRIITGRLNSADSQQPAKEWLGALLVGRDAPSVYDETMTYVWWTLTSQAATVIQTARLQRESQQRLRELALLLDTSAALSTSLDLENALHATAHQISTAFTASGCSISRWDQDQDALVVLLDYTVDPDRWEPVRAGTVYPLADYPASHRVLLHRQPVVIQASDGDADPAEVEWMIADNIRSLLMVPLVVRDEAVGLLELMQLDDEREFTPTEIGLCQTLANQAAATLANAQLFAQTQRRSVQLQTASEVSHAAGSILGPDQLMQQVVDLVRDRFGLYYVGLFLVDETGEWAVLRAGTGEAGRIQIEQGHKLAVGSESMIGWCITNAQARIAQDVGEESTRFINPLLPETRSEMALPLISRGRVIGAMTIQSADAAAFSEDDISSLQTMVDQLSNAIQNARLYEESTQRTEELSTLNAIAATISRSLEMQDLLDAVLDAVLAITGFDAGLISLHSEETGELYLASHRNLPDPMVRVFEESGLGGTLCDVVFKTGETLGLGDIREGAPVDVTGLIRNGFLAYAGLPLVHQDLTLGTLCVFGGSVRSVDAPLLSLLEAIGHQIGVGIQNARLFNQVQASLTETEEQARRLMLLNEMSKELSQAVSLDEILETTAFKTGQILPCDRVTVTLLNAKGDSFTVLAQHGEIGRIPIGTQLPLAGSSIETAVREGRLVCTSDAQTGSLGGVRSFMVAPLLAGGRTIGTLNVGNKKPSIFVRRDENLLLQIASLLSSAMENRRLFEQTQQRLADLRTIQETTSELTAKLSFNAATDVILRQAAHAVQADRVSMFLIDEEHMTRVGTYPLREGDRDLIGQTNVLSDYPLTKRVVETRRPLALMADDPRLQEHARRAFKDSGVVASATIPLVGREGVLGTLAVSSHQPGRAFTDHDTSLLQTLADQATIAFERIRLSEQTQASAEELSILFDVSQELSSALLQPDEIAATVARRLVELGDLEYSVSLLEEDRNTMRVLADFFLEEGTIREVETEETYRLSEYPATARTMEMLQPLVVQANDPDGDLAELAYMRELGITTLAIIPLSVKGEAIGVMELESWEEYHYSPEQLNLITTLANQAAAALENARLLEEMQRRADRERQLRQVVATINASEDLMVELDTIAQMVCEFTPANVIALVSYTPGDAEFTYIAAGAGAQDTPAERRGVRLPIKGSGPGWVIAHKEPWIGTDLRKDHRFAEDERMAEDGVVSRMIVPLRIGEQVIGTLNLGSPQPNVFGEEHSTFISQVADQLALALDRARLLEETREALAEVQATHQRYLRGQWEGVLNAGPDRVWGYIDGPHGLTATNELWTPEVEKAVVSGMPAIVDEPTDGNGEAPRSGLAVPIRLLGQTIGVLDFFDEERVWTEHDKALVEALADQVALALENQRLFEQTQRRAYREHLTSEIVGRIRAAGDIQSILETAAEELGHALGISRTRVRLGDPTDGSVLPQKPVQSAGEPESQDNTG